MTNVIGREAFKAADIAEHRARKLALVDARKELERTLEAAELAFRQSRPAGCEADRVESTAALDDAKLAARNAAALAGVLDAAFGRLHKSDLADAPAANDFAALAETIADRFSNDDLARVFLAAFALEGN